MLDLSERFHEVRVRGAARTLRFLRSGGYWFGNPVPGARGLCCRVVRRFGDARDDASYGFYLVTGDAVIDLGDLELQIGPIGFDLKLTICGRHVGHWSMASVDFDGGFGTPFFKEEPRHRSRWVACGSVWMDERDWEMPQQAGSVRGFHGRSHRLVSGTSRQWGAKVQGRGQFTVQCFDQELHFDPLRWVAVQEHAILERAYNAYARLLSDLEESDLPEDDIPLPQHGKGAYRDGKRTRRTALLAHREAIRVARDAVAPAAG